MQQENNKKILDNMPRLEWACRRGMLELDVLLGNFLKEAYQKLNDSDKQLFVNLLNCTDPELFGWLMGHQTPADEWASIVEMIKQHARTRL